MNRSLASLAAAAAALVAPIAVPTAPAGADNPVCSAKKCSFVSPNHTVCTVAADNAACGWSDGEKWFAVKLFPNGGLDPCLHLLDVPGRKCDTYSTAGVPTLGYGQTAELGPYTCLVDAQSVTCTVKPSGRGFTINSAGIVPAAAPPPPAAPAPSESASPAPAPSPVPSPAPDVTALAPPPAPPETPLPPEGPPPVPPLPLDEGPNVTPP